MWDGVSVEWGGSGVWDGVVVVYAKCEEGVRGVLGEVFGGNVRGFEKWCDPRPSIGSF